MPEIQHVGILVSKANGCPYCTAAFSTILNYGLGAAEEAVARVLSDGIDGVDEPRLKVILQFALKVNADAKSVTDTDIDALRELGLTDKSIVQIVHLVSDFAAYNRLNLALDTDYDYRDLWRSLAFGWEQKSGSTAGDNTRGIRG